MEGMSEDIAHEINLDLFRANFNKYTRKAFEMLPALEKPRILDIGCGSGIPTIELARLSKGEVIGIDIDQAGLDKLTRTIEEKGFSNRMKTMRCSLLEINYPNESFDILWAEGVLNLIGYDKSFKECNRLLKPNGFLVIHDTAAMIKNELGKLPSYGYKLVNSFSLPEDAWWIEYYGPLEIRINELSKKYKNDPEARAIFKKHQKEINMVKKNPKAFASAFFILQKLNF